MLVILKAIGFFVLIGVGGLDKIIRQIFIVYGGKLPLMKISQISVSATEAIVLRIRFIEVDLMLDQKLVKLIASLDNSDLLYNFKL